MMYGHVMSCVQLTAVRVLPRGILIILTRPRFPHHRNFALCDIESTSHIPSYTSPHPPAIDHPTIQTIHPNKATGKQHLIYVQLEGAFHSYKVHDSAMNAGQSDGNWKRKLEDQTAVWEYFEKLTPILFTAWSPLRPSTW